MCKVFNFYPLLTATDYSNKYDNKNINQFVSKVPALLTRLLNFFFNDVH